MNEGRTTESSLPSVEGTLLPDFRDGASSSSQPSPPEAIRGRCLPNRQLSPRLMEPYLSEPDVDGPLMAEELDRLEASERPEDPDLGVTVLLRPEGTYLGAGAEGGVTIER